LRPPAPSAFSYSASSSSSAPSSSSSFLAPPSSSLRRPSPDPKFASTSSAVCEKTELAAAIADKIAAESRLQELTTDLAIVLSQQKALLAALEGRTKRLAEAERELAELRGEGAGRNAGLEDRLAAALSDLEKARASEAESREAARVAFGGMEAARREVERKKGAIVAMKNHGSKAAESCRILLDESFAATGAVRLELAAARSELALYAARTAELEETAACASEERSKKESLHLQCQSLLDVVERQQGMLVDFQKEKASLHERLQRSVMEGERRSFPETDPPTIAYNVW